VVTRVAGGVVALAVESRGARRSSTAASRTIATKTTAPDTTSTRH
jgi:hypothetical protein